jgi:hypothetical protein
VTSWDVLTTAVADRSGLSVGVAGALLSIGVYLAGWLRLLRWRRTPSWEPPSGGAGAEELEAGDGQVAQNGERREDEGARHERPPRRV